jgi:hypothetical protein
MTNNYTDKEDYCPNCGSFDHELCKIEVKGVWGMGDTDKLDNFLDNAEITYIDEDDSLVYVHLNTDFKTALKALINRDYILKSEILSAIGEEEERYSYSAPLEMPVDQHRELLGRQQGRNKLRAELKTKLGLEK